MEESSLFSVSPRLLVYYNVFIDNINRFSPLTQRHLVRPPCEERYRWICYVLSKEQTEEGPCKTQLVFPYNLIFLAVHHSIFPLMVGVLRNRPYIFLYKEIFLGL